MNELLIQLQQWLAASEHHKAIARFPTPDCLKVTGKTFGGGKFSAAGSVSAYEIRVTEYAGGTFSMLLLPTPEVASRKAAEDCRAPGVISLPLQGEKCFFDAIHERCFAARRV